MIADRILSNESGGNSYAANPRSTARGAGQFIDATWLDMLAKHRPDLTTNKSRDEILALRNDPSLSRAMTEAYASENSNVLSKAGLPVTAGTTYLAHFAGPQGAVNVLKADPASPVGSVLGEAAVKANPFLQGMTVSDLRSWADRKMGKMAPMAMSAAPPQSPMGAPGATSLGSLAGMMGTQQANPMAGLGAVASMFGSMAPSETQPELLAPPAPPLVRPKVDLTRLRAALKKRA